LALTNGGAKVLALCKRTGFASDRVRFVPISAYTVDNVITKSKHMAWWTGPTLLQSMLETIQALPVWANPRRRLALVRTSPSLLSCEAKSDKSLITNWPRRRSSPCVWWYTAAR
jgi:hypothetical protein